MFEDKILAVPKDQDTALIKQRLISVLVEFWEEGGKVRTTLSASVAALKDEELSRRFEGVSALLE